MDSRLARVCSVGCCVCPSFAFARCQLASFRPLDAAQTNFLRSVFLSLSDRPSDQTAVSAFVRAHYRDIPSAARGALGQGVLELFASEERNAELSAQRKADAIAAGQSAAEAAAAAAAAVQSERPPRISWRSFHRVCAALGLHLNERRGQAAIRKFASDDNSAAAASASAAAAAAAASSSSAASASASVSADVGMSFDDFLVFYSGVSKHLSVDQELREVWRLLDADLSGVVPLRVLAQVMVGLERVAPTNEAERSRYFYDSSVGYGWSDAEKRMSPEQLVESQLAAVFAPRGKSVQQDSTIVFSEFVEFMYA